jgi:squalene-hopene/tetraprenyl-beta-curcumene cyclase
MPPVETTSAVERTRRAARERLLAARVPAGHWVGELSPSALSTATAVAALEILRRQGSADLEPLVRRGVEWLRAQRNADGGYGDTPDSPSNISTTVLCWAALGMHGGAPEAEAWIRREAGDLAPAALAGTICRRYGGDRTFSVPILTMCALAGCIDWRDVPALPFELAALPRSWFGPLGLPVVSYALPALIAIGQARHVHRPTWNPVARVLRWATKARTLRILEDIQPSSGGFLEATPLTSFVAMSLAGSGQGDHPVTRRAVDFLIRSARPDGSWPIDTNLATWVTTLAVQALEGDVDREAVRAWLIGQQMKTVHPYTGAAPGGWAWTDLPGGVPDADDTPGALLALRLLDGAPEAARAGVEWLLGLQNRDGGIPTFCRGWGKLPFDRSCPDLTAHALRAWKAWRDVAPERIDAASLRAARYLVESQRPDGSWIPLWFGNQRAPEQENPVYGTSRVLLAEHDDPEWRAARERGRTWLLRAQNPDGGWGGAPGIPSTIEETALAVQALDGPEAERGRRWLVERTAEGTEFPASPIGLYFAKLWYSERLYPMIFTVAALGPA